MKESNITTVTLPSLVLNSHFSSYSELQQQKNTYQQLYAEKDEAFNQVYLQLASDKEKQQMAKDKYIIDFIYCNNI